jgi:3'(2'), 5'-bisphosphate nucleotidase
MNLNQLLIDAIHASIEGGKEILSIYNTAFEVEYKDDKSPVTAADKKASKVIEDKLASSGYPFLSEEGKHTEYDVRKNWNAYWLVDPLDGTKEFIKRNGEFTVNIALIENSIPILGVIYCPVTNDLYYSAKGQGAYKINIHSSHNTMDLDEIITKSQKLPIQLDSSNYILVASRSHLSSETYQHIETTKLQHTNVSIVNVGSSLKLCLIAEGKANEYPRFGPTMEWDIAAGHAILLESGANVIDHSTQAQMKYNKPDLLNNWFIAKR